MRLIGTILCRKLSRGDKFNHDHMSWCPCSYHVTLCCCSTPPPYVLCLASPLLQLVLLSSQCGLSPWLHVLLSNTIVTKKEKHDHMITLFSIGSRTDHVHTMHTHPDLGLVGKRRSAEEDSPPPCFLDRGGRGSTAEALLRRKAEHSEEFLDWVLTHEC